MMRKNYFKKYNALFSILLITGLVINPGITRAESAVIADVQMVSLNEQDSVFYIRSSDSQAFDVLPQSDPLKTKLKLFNASLGHLTELGAASFGSLTLSEENGAVFVNISLNDPAYKVKVKQGDNSNTVEVRVQWVPDTAMPEISSISVTDIGNDTATISWVTDELSDSQVAYGASQPESQLSGLDTQLTSSHQIILTGLSSGTQYYFRVHSKDAAGNQAVSSTSIFTTASTVEAFVESAGQVVFEAEHFDTKIPRSNKDWIFKTAQAGFSGNGYLVSSPNTSLLIDTDFVTSSPELVYTVNFSKTGTYYVWVRGRGISGNDDSLHAGIDGTAPATSDRISSFPSSWKWIRSTMDSPAATIVVSTPGIHTFHLWMREDGVEIDKILLRTNSSSTAPSGSGPSESSRS